MFERGYIQVYTGEGKGKTTAAVGLTIRALGAGLKVAFLQFFKSEDSSEVKILKSLFPRLYYQAFHTKGFIKGKIPSELERIIKEGYEIFKKLLFSKEYDLIILDEFTYALNWNIIDLEEFLEILEEKPKEVEIVITGRGAPLSLIEKSDLVTIMHPLKHYFEKGVEARWGIEK